MALLWLIILELDINIVKGFLYRAMDARENSFRNICEMNQTPSIFRLMMFWFAVNAINVFATERFALKASFRPWHHRPSTELIYVRAQIVTNMTLNSLWWTKRAKMTGSNQIHRKLSRLVVFLCFWRSSEDSQRTSTNLFEAYVGKIHFEPVSDAFVLSQEFFNNVWRKFIKCCHGKQTSSLCVMNSAKFFPMFKTTREILEKS